MQIIGATQKMSATWTGKRVKIDLKVAMDKILENRVDIIYGWSNMNIEMKLHEFLDPIV